ncbi:gliding motility lipoprotein GldD [Aurantibacter sp.]|uniref:gliding motility lipoprotein GldD n=1 Tax=Flavobacteriaceae TaxID=49546 RepID=UPI0035C7A90B
MYRILTFFLLSFLVACQEDITPKPKAQLRLSYPDATYKTKDANLPFNFDINTFSDTLKISKIRGDKESIAVNIEYPRLKGTIYLTYKPVNKSAENLKKYLIDAQNFTQEHTKKADDIVEQPYINKERKVYGMFYEVGGNAASQSQFYVTDSTNHFLTGSLYFYAKPNYDSILPAAHYLKNDIQKLMETITWK